MGLAGILTVALIVSADQSNAGIGGMRGITAFAPSNEQDPPQNGQNGQIPVLSGILDAVRGLPIFTAPAPSPVAVPSPAAPLESAPPASSGTVPATTVPVRTPAPTPSTAPVPAVVTPPTATPAPTTGPTLAPSTPAPLPVPPAATPTPTPTPTPSASPAPVLQVSTDRGAVASVTLGDLVPGDTISRTITVKNTGTLGFRYVVSATQTAGTLLWTDLTDGLQLTVADSGGAVLYAGSLSGLGTLAGPGTLAPGGSELLRYTFALPTSASDAFQGLLQDLTLVFTATQYP